MTVKDFVSTFNWKHCYGYRICIYTKKDNGEAVFQYSGDFIGDKNIPKELMDCKIIKWRYSKRENLGTGSTFMVNIE